MLDQKLDEWRKAICEHLSKSTEVPPELRLRLTAGDMSVKVAGDQLLHEIGSDIAQDIQEVCRGRLVPQAWPLSLCYRINREQDVMLDEIEISGIRLRGYTNRKLVSSETINWRRHSTTLTGLDRIASDFDLIGKMSPPSNQPVRAWSIGHTIMGSPHVSHDGIYARTEAEALLKMEWERYGREGLEEVLSNGTLPVRRNDEKLFFVSSDLYDFDIDPEGRLARKDDARNDLAQHLENLREVEESVEP